MAIKSKGKATNRYAVAERGRVSQGKGKAIQRIVQLRNSYANNELTNTKYNGENR